MLLGVGTHCVDGAALIAHTLLPPWLCLAGRDYIHQLALLNVDTCQLLTVLLRTCPRSIGRQAAEVGAGGRERGRERRGRGGDRAKEKGSE